MAKLPEPTGDVIGVFEKPVATFDNKHLSPADEILREISVADDMLKELINDLSQMETDSD